MKIIKTKQNTQEWLELRRGKITGSKLKDVVVQKDATKEEIMKELDSAKIEYNKSDRKDELVKLLPEDVKDKLSYSSDKKLGFYQLLADTIATVPNSDDDPREHGHTYEKEALDSFEELIKVKVDKDVGLCVSEDNPNIALSPDGLIKLDGKFKAAVEVKCLSSARHLQAYFEQKIPSDYKFQVLQYFIVNSDLEKLYFVFYDPRIPSLPIHFLEVERVCVERDIERYRRYQELLLQELEEYSNKLF